MKSHFKHQINAVLLCLLFLCSVQVQGSGPLWPGTSYSDDIPSFKDVLGYEVGEKIATNAEMYAYFDALQKAAPDRVQVHEYAKSWQGRPLIYVIIASPENLKNIDELTSNVQKLADPRVTSQRQAKSIIDSQPAFVWLQYSVHGNEISGTDAAMMMAYHLLAAPDDPINKNILDNTVVFIDPLQNPDGRERFVSRYYATVGMEHSPDRLSAEHNQPWPSGRLNHYLFDMNRDWLAITQPESKGRIAAINEYLPQVIVDVHEMGGDLSYYFAPAAQPFNPFMTPTQIANMNAIGKNHAKHFDDFGFDYFTREIFDAFYPGYGDSWPTFYGASASTYEVGSARGMFFKKSNGDTITFWDTVQRQFVASMSTAEGTALTREKLLNDFYQYQVDAIEEGEENKERIYVLPNESNREGTHRLATLMAEHGVEVSKASEDFYACGKRYQPGSFVIDTAQPRGRFVSMAFTEQVDMAEDFLKEQERRRARNLNDQIYDVTGWSLPMMLNVESAACSKSVKVDGDLVSATDVLLGEVNKPNAEVAFLVPWGDMSATRFLSSALKHDIKLKSVDAAFVLDDNKRYPAGTLVIEKSNNYQRLAEKIAKIAKETGAIVDGADTSWVTAGPSFGSPNTVSMVAPRVALAWGESTSALSAGNTRFVIERQLGYPVTAITLPVMARSNLDDYDVIILPEGNYARALGKSGADNLKAWVQQGGVLISLGAANRFLTSKNIGLLDVKRESAFREEKQKSGAKDKDVAAGKRFETRDDLSNAIVENNTSPDNVSGVLVNIEVDQEHWLTAGVDEALVTVAYGRDIYTPITLDSGKNLAWFKGKDELLASGYLWEENRLQLAYKPLLIHQPMGRGMVIGFTQSPTYRAYLEGMNTLLANSIFRAAAHAQN